jgi:Large polyvalent protein associated domain 30
MNRTITDRIVVGTRVHSILYGGRDGVVYAIHGEQSPSSVRSIGGFMQTGGRAEFDIVFDDGTETRHLPECIIRGVQ